MKYIFINKTAYGEDAEIIEADSQEEANKIAFDKWLEDAQASANYKAVPFDQEIADDYDLDEEDV